MYSTSCPQELRLGRGKALSAAESGLLEEGEAIASFYGHPGLEQWFFEKRLGSEQTESLKKIMEYPFPNENVLNETCGSMIGNEGAERSDDFDIPPLPPQLRNLKPDRSFITQWKEAHTRSELPTSKWISAVLLVRRKS